MSNANTALLTGASAGIGAVYADRLARRGHDLILVARDETRLNAQAVRLRAETGRSVEILAADLAARSGLLRVEHRLRQDPSIGMLVNNAGIAVAGPMHGSDVDRLEAMANGRGSTTRVSRWGQICRWRPRPSDTMGREKPRDRGNEAWSGPGHRLRRHRAGQSRPVHRQCGATEHRAGVR
jgi:hypothetical protein